MCDFLSLSLLRVDFDYFLLREFSYLLFWDGETVATVRTVHSDCSEAREDKTRSIRTSSDVSVLDGKLQFTMKIYMQWYKRQHEHSLFSNCQQGAQQRQDEGKRTARRRNNDAIRQPGRRGCCRRRDRNSGTCGRGRRSGIAAVAPALAPRGAVCLRVPTEAFGAVAHSFVSGTFLSLSLQMERELTCSTAHTQTRQTAQSRPDRRRSCRWSC